MSDIAAVGQTIAVAAQALADNMETAWDNDRKDAYLKGYSCVQMAVIVAGSLRASGWQSPDQIAALTSRAEAAECQLAAVQKLYGDKSEQYLAERRRTDAAEAQVAACRGYVQDWDDSKKAAVDVIAKIRAVTASSLPASPATEKLQARVKELEIVLGEHVTLFRESLQQVTNAALLAKLTDDTPTLSKSTEARAKLEPLIRRAASALKGETQ